MPQTAKDDLDEIIRWQKEQTYFFDKILGVTLWEKQLEIAESVRDNERTVVPSSFKVGKSFVAASIGLWFLYSFYPSKVITTATTGRQLKDILWREIRGQHQKAKVPLGGEPLTQSLSLDDDWFMTGFSTKEYDPDKFTGYHSEHVLVIFDQASGIPKLLWDASETLMSGIHCRWLAIGNCWDATSEFAKVSKPGSGWNTIHISAYDTPNVKAGKNVYPGLIAWDWPDKKKKQWGEDSILFQVLVKGEFPREGTDNLIPWSLVENAMEDEVAETEVLEIGLDPAEFGDDLTVRIARRGRRIVIAQYEGKQDPMETVGKTIHLAQDLAEKYRYGVTDEDNTPKPKEIPIKVDTIGIGSGIHSRLKEQGYNAQAIMVSESARKPKKYRNLRTELAFNCQEQFKEGVGISIDIPNETKQLWAAEMIEPRYKINSSGQYVLEPKEEIKKRLGRSPGFFDGTILAFAPPKAKRKLEVEWI